MRKPGDCYFHGQDEDGFDGTTVCSNEGDDDMFCFGCDELICSNHSIAGSLMGGHEPGDHLAWDDELEDW